MKGVLLCRLSELNDLEAREFSIENSDTPDIFLIKKNEQLFAYQNSCPHTGAPLNWQANRFLSHQKDKILCTMHGALFNIETGYCDYGPCAGDYLRKIELCIKDDAILLLNP